ncbi:MAG: hypothetical protein EOO70_01300, partial [Myxococcaceae bacterium]
GTSEDFEYDSFDQLNAWQVTQHGARSRQEFGYDDIGNLESHRVVAGPGFTTQFAYDGVKPHAAMRRTQRGMTRFLGYNLVGNQVDNGAGRTIQYSAVDLPKQISQNQATTLFKYDGAQNRVLKTLANGDEVLSLGRIYERKTTAGVVEHVFHLHANGALVAQVRWREGGQGTLTDGGVNYVHSDLLGTPSAVTNEQGQVVERLKFAPFGTRQSNSDLAQKLDISSLLGRSFQGHTADDESGLVNMGGRIYEPDSGAFLTPDPVVSGSLNRYRFGFNNPLNNTDPTGFDVFGTGLSIFRTILGGGGMGWGGGLNPSPVPSHYNSEDWYYYSSPGGGTSNTINTGESTKPSAIPNAHYYYPPSINRSTVSLPYGGGGGDVSPRVNTPTGNWVNGASHAAASILAEAPAAYALSVMPVYQALVGTVGLGRQLKASVKDYGVLGGLVDTFNPAGKVLEHGWLASEAFDAGNSYAGGEHSLYAAAWGIQTILMAAGMYKTGASTVDAMGRVGASGTALTEMAGHIGADASAGRKAPFNPTGGKNNCVNGVCAFLESVRDGTLNLDAALEPVRANGGIIRVALNQIRNRVGVRWGVPQLNTLKTGRGTQFFVVFEGSNATTSGHVLIGITRNGRSMLYDPQRAQRFIPPSDFGPFTAYPLIFE